jgi:hypothetical protein
MVVVDFYCAVFGGAEWGVPELLLGDGHGDVEVLVLEGEDVGAVQVGLADYTDGFVGALWVVDLELG